MLHGYKGAVQLPSGRSLVGELVERLRAADRFDDPILIGPRRVYEGHVDCEVVDVEGNLATTLEAVRELIRSRFDLAAPLALSTCDILPTGEETRRLMAECYDPHAGCSFWGQLITAEPGQMGASCWKPSYHFLPDVGQPPVNMYPGHLIIARPGALRMRLTNHLLQLAYSHRNIELHKRRFRMIARGVGRLVAEDFQNLFALQMPKLAVSIPAACLSAYGKFRRGTLTVPQFADYVSRVFLHREFRRSAEGPSAVFSLAPIVSFAKDIDTKAELDEAAGMTAPPADV